ncbi:MAG: TrmH family RNA methyltransferase [Candidatus Omnitrophica bacterium]|nr:TrmH family RNA methyltransferase [Candidatus Omnitrophota bacterium]
MRKFTHQEIVARQKIRAREPRIPLTVVLDNIRSLHNVGAIFRSGDGVGVEKIWLCGITGFPPQAQISKIALGAEERVPWDHCRDVVKVVKKLKKAGYQIVLLEQTDTSVGYQHFVPEKPICLVVGNEVEGVSGDLIALADVAVDIEMGGIKNSLNVSVAFGIVVYHLRNCINRENVFSGSKK